MADREILELQRRLQRFLLARRRNPAADVVRQATLHVLQRPRKHGWRAYLVGGFLRDILTSEHWRTPRDFDIVVQGCSSNKLSSMFEDLSYGRNRFGGLNLRCLVDPSEPNRSEHRIDFDVWRLEDTWGVRNQDFQPTMDAFVRTPFLNVDSIAVSIPQDQDKSDFEIFEFGFFQALERRCIDINYSENPYPVLCAARAMILAVKLDYSIGSNLSSFICEVASQATADEFAAAQRSHYGFEMYSRKQFALWICEIRDQARNHSQDFRLSSPSEQPA